MGANSNISPERGTIPSPLTARPPAIEPDTLRLLYTNSIIGLAASLILATVVAITHWSVISHVVLLAWWSGMALLTAARTISIVRFRKFPGEPRSTSPWFAWHFAGTALSGVAWSTAGIFLFAPDSSEHHRGPAPRHDRNGGPPLLGHHDLACLEPQPRVYENIRAQRRTATG